MTIVEPGYFRTDFLDASSLETEANIIDDYADTAGATRAHATDVNHNQPGDPVKAAAAIVDLASSPEPPLRIQLGRDAFEGVSNKLVIRGRGAECLAGRGDLDRPRRRRGFVRRLCRRVQ